MRKNNLTVLFAFCLLLGSCGEDPVKEKEMPKETKSNTEEQIGSTPQGTSDPDPVLAPEYLAGDIILQTSEGHQSDLVSIATQSPFSHCGIIILKKDGTKMVIEANGTVKQTPLDEWIQNGKEGKYVIMRLKNPGMLTGDILQKAGKYFKSLLGKNYDAKYLWNDTEFYCSELVWKLYQNAVQIELCKPRKLKEYEISSPEIKAELEKKYGTSVPYEELMVAPADIAASDYLEMIYSNY